MSQRIPILMYHKIAPVNRRSKFAGQYVTPGMFDRQLRAMRLMGFESVPLSDLFGRPDLARPFVLTFDDGYRNFRTNALPALQRHGFSSTVFLVSRQLGGTNRWDVEIGDVEERLMTIEEIGECRAGGTEFGSHTANHVHLADVDSETAWREISDSRCELEDALRCPIPTFCYPYGSWSLEVRDMVARAGYRYACSTDKGVNDQRTDRFVLKRINVRRDSVLPVFVLKIWRALKLDR